MCAEICYGIIKSNKSCKKKKKKVSFIGKLNNIL